VIHIHHISFTKPLATFPAFTTRGLIDALLELEHATLDFSPADRVPSIHRFHNRAHSVFTLIYTSIIQVIVSASAYPVAFPWAFASQTIPLPGGLRLTPTADFAAEPLVRYPVPKPRLTSHLGTHCSPGYFRDAVRIRNKAVRPFTLSILDPADSPRRLVKINDDSDVSLFAYPYATLLDGIRRRARRYRLSFPLHGLRVSRCRGECASPLHLRDRNLTCTKLQLSKTILSLSSIPDQQRHFGGTVRSHSCLNATNGSTLVARRADR
jgi:hypothetical protein